MNLVNKEYHKRARILLENWQDSGSGASALEEPTGEALSKKLELNLLEADASISDVNKLCKTAKLYGLAGICVNPTHIQRCIQILGDDIPTGAVIAFPLGANHPQIKVAEAVLAVSHGARRISMVLNIGLLKTSNIQEVFEELRAVRQACPEVDLAVILETALLEPMQIIIACMLCREAGLDEVVTSTGFRSMGATLENVSLMRSVIGDDLGVVASGGIKSRNQVMNLFKAGATSQRLAFLGSSETLSNLTDSPDRSVNE